MTEAARRELVSKTRRSGMLTVIQRAAGGLLRLGSNMVLAMLLFPEAFGLMVLVNVFLAGLQLFSDTGIGPSIVRSKRGEDRAFYSTAWTIQVIRGIVLSLLCLLLAQPYADLFEKPELALLVSIGAITSFVAGFQSPHWFTADRNQQLGRKVMIDLLGQFVGIITMVVWAWQTRSVVALVVGGVAASIVTTVLSHLLIPGGRVRFQIERAAASELFGFGSWIFASTAISFLAMQSDRMLLGGLLSAYWLGMFGIGVGLLSICTMFIQSLSRSVVFPAWMNSRRVSPHDHLAVMVRTRSALLCVALAVLVGVAVGAPPLFRLFYDDRYQGALPVVQLLCIATWFASMNSVSTSAALVFGDSRSIMSANLAVFLTKIPFCYAGYQLLGLTGFLIGGALANFMGSYLLAMALSKHGLKIRKTDLDLTLRALVFLQLAILPTAFPLQGWQLLAAECAWGALIVMAALWPARFFIRSVLNRT
jgi:O-antigen/teichoic acid export membrane protein